MFGETEMEKKGGGRTVPPPRDAVERLQCGQARLPLDPCPARCVA